MTTFPSLHGCTPVVTSLWDLAQSCLGDISNLFGLPKQSVCCSLQGPTVRLPSEGCILST